MTMEAMTMASSSNLALRPRQLRPWRRAALPTRRPPAAPTQLSVERTTRPPAGEKTATSTRLYSLAPYPLLLAALLPGAEPVTAAFQPFVDIVKTFSLPDWLVHWGHPGNMAVVLFAMGGYGTYLGFRIKLSDDPEEKAKDLHPKLLGGMFFFFAAGGVTALLTSGKPIFGRETLLGSSIMTLFLFHAAFGLQPGLSF